MIKRVLGLDLSSTTMGFCLLLWNEETNAIKLQTVSYFKPSKKGSLLERLRDTRDRMAEIINDLKPDLVAIEDIITFMPRRSTAATIILLAVFNRMIALLAFDYTGRPPVFFSVMDIRRGLQRGEKAPGKDEMPELTATHLGLTFPYQKNKKGKLKIENGDMADAMAVALFYVLVLSGKRLDPNETRERKKRIKKMIGKAETKKRKKKR